MRRAEVTTSTEWGTGDAAASCALQATKTTEKNEQLLRIYHPALRDKQHVSVSESRYGPPIWLVRDRATGVQAGGRAIHNYLVDHSEFRHSMTIPCLSTKYQWLFRLPINPRKLLRPTQLDNLRECRDDLKDVYSCWTTWVLEVGGLYVFYDVVGVDLTTKSETGVISSNSRAWKGGLGLRLDIPDGTEAVTTVTLGSVYNHFPSLIPRTLRNWARSARNAILRLCNLPCPLPDSPVGKEVSPHLDSKLIGTMIHTYDNPSITRSYPAGYTHDLSLIAGERLPSITSSTGGPHITSWASYTEALSGVPAYTMRPSANEIQPEIQPAKIVSTQYLWDREKQYEYGLLGGGFLVPGEVRDARIV